MHEFELGYIGLQVSDPAAMAGFFAGVVGLAEGAPTASGSTTWRNDDCAQRIIVGDGPLDDVAFVGLEAVDGESFDRVAERLTVAGFSLAEGTEADLADRRVERLVHTTAPWGVRIELAQGLERLSSAPKLPLVPGGFLTSGVGFGHVVFATTNFDASHEFVTAALGMVRSDWLEIELAPAISLEVRFYHCNERHHTIALARAPFDLPQRLHHVMLETNERDDVGAAFDRAWASGLSIPNGLGRHDNDGMFSFYVATPAGFQVEIGHGARVVTQDWDDDRRYDRISAWGHQALRQA